MLNTLREWHCNSLLQLLQQCVAVMMAQCICHITTDTQRECVCVCTGSYQKTNAALQNFGDYASRKLGTIRYSLLCASIMS